MEINLSAKTIPLFGPLFAPDFKQAIKSHLFGMCYRISPLAAMARLSRMQHHRLRKQVHMLQVSCHLPLPQWLWNMDPACWLWEKDPGFRNLMPQETSLHLLFGAQDQHLHVKQDQLPCGFTGNSSGNCQETETCTDPACHTLRQPLQNPPSGHLGGWAMQWLAEELLDGQLQRVDIPTHARTAHKCLLQKRLEEDLCWIDPHVPKTTQSVKRLNWTDQNLRVFCLICHTCCSFCVL